MRKYSKVLSAVIVLVRLSLKRGTKVERSNREGLKNFAELMKITGERDGF